MPKHDFDQKGRQISGLFSRHWPSRRLFNHEKKAGQGALIAAKFAALRWKKNSEFTYPIEIMRTRKLAPDLHVTVRADSNCGVGARNSLGLQAALARSLKARPPGELDAT